MRSGTEAIGHCGRKVSEYMGGIGLYGAKEFSACPMSAMGKIIEVAVSGLSAEPQRVRQPELVKTYGF